MAYQSSSSATLVFSRTNKYSLVSSFVLPVFLSFAQNAAGQGVQLRPVARLVSEPAAEAIYSRPRRVTPEEGASEPEASSLPPSAAIEEPTTIERIAFEKTNQARSEHGRTPLVWDSELCRMARVHSERMARQRFFAHETPEGMQLTDRARALGIIHFRVIGENIAYNKNVDDPGAFAVERWMTSGGHRANILYIGFQASAIGSYIAADGSVYLTQVFISR